MRLRQAVRGLMIDPENRIVMVKLEWASTGWSGWVLPGGGIEAGEDDATALRRELIEETGVPQVFVGPPVLERTFLMPKVFDGEWDGQHDTVYLVPTHAFELAPEMSAAELLAENVVDVRWWSQAELAETDEVIQPENLTELLAYVLEHGAPNEPWQLKID